MENLVMVAFEAIEKGVKPGTVAEFSNDCKKWVKRSLKELENNPKGFTTDAGDEAVKRKVSRWNFMRLIPEPEQAEIEFEGVQTDRDRIMTKIYAERIKQHSKWGEQNHKAIEWIAILGEEFGEVSKEACELYFESFESEEEYRAKEAKYEKELIQVAAVAVQMLECLYRNQNKR